jgi:DNA-binding SARP family transcriptional activator
LLIHNHQVFPIEDHLARRGPHQPENAAPQRGLATTGLSHQTEELAGIDRQAYPIDSADLTGEGEEADVVEARQACEEALHLYAGSPETYELCVCRSVLGDVLLDLGALNTAMEYFLDLRRSCESRQFRLPLAMVYFALGYLYLQADRREAALELIRRSMGIVRHANAIQLYVDQGQPAVTVCRAAQEAGIYPAFAEPIISALMPAQELAQQSIRPAPAPPTGEDTRENAIDVITLGDFRLFYNDEEIGSEVGLTAKPKELLAYFITHRHQRLPLDRVLEDVWPESTPSRGQASFHTTMHRLRQALGRVAGSGDYICYESRGYQLERERFQIDVELFDASIARAQLTTDEEAIRAYEAAVEQYGGPFLASFYHGWCEDVRRRLSVACLTALRFLVAHYAAAGDYHQAIGACEWMLEIDPLLEQTHCDLMRFWHRLGNRAAVMKQYKMLKDIMAEEMSMEPMPETQALYAELA